MQLQETLPRHPHQPCKSRSARFESQHRGVDTADQMPHSPGLDGMISSGGDASPALKALTPMCSLTHQLPMCVQPRWKNLIQQRCIRTVWSMCRHGVLRKLAIPELHPLVPAYDSAYGSVDSFDVVELGHLRTNTDPVLQEVAGGIYGWHATSDVMKDGE